MRREDVGSDLRWIDITDPHEEDLAFLRDTLHFHPVDVAECRKPSPLPKLRVMPTYLFLIVHIPSFVTEKRATVPVEIDVFVSSDVLVTVHEASVPILATLLASVSSKEDLRARYLGRGPALLLYSLLEQLFDTAPPMLNHIIERLTRAEEGVFSGRERVMVAELSALRRDLLGFRSIFRPQRHLYEPGVLHGAWDSPTFRVVFRSLNGKLSRIWDHLETLWERAEALGQANDQLLNFKLGEFAKLIMVIGAVFVPLGLVAQVIISLAGDVPFIHRFIFWSIIALLLVIDFVILWHARWRKIL